FLRLDLVSCRNVLIYVEPSLQRRVLSVFHYALKPTGFLLLGHSETTSRAPELFRVVDRRHKIFARTQAIPRMAVDFGSAMQSVSAGHLARPLAARAPAESALQSVQREADRVVMARYAPAGVIINEDRHVVQFRGQTGHFLEPAPGEPTFNVMKMARPPLAMAIRAAVHKAQQTGEQVRSGIVPVQSNGASLNVEVVMLPLRSSPREDRLGGHHYLVLFEEPRSAPPAPGAAKKGKKGAAEPPLSAGERREFGRLKQELAITREHMQSIIEEREAVNEELQSANEEILSSNEELQSINEELETAKEELQSTNEELTTLNEELRTRNTELTQLNNDLNNSLSSVNLPIVMLSTDLRIRRFTPMAERVLNLIPTDVGRPIGDIRPKIEVGDLEARISDVIDTMRIFEADVRDRDGRWYSMRIRPYRTADNKIEGAVLTLVDIDESRRAVERVEGLREYTEALFALVPTPLCVLDGELRVQGVNEAFLRLFRTTPEATRGRLLEELGDEPWNLQGLRVLIEEPPPGEAAPRDYLVEHDFPGVGRRKIRVNVTRVPRDGRAVEFILLSFEEMRPSQRAAPGGGGDA
ncbi:MAG TPA: PAS domain-containing protein, partial [Candidatus Nanopelagicales bacterium]|nr:PAS domain-containing protein [Candidatus Nanopelagicales bacterium]